MKEGNWRIGLAVAAAFCAGATVTSFVAAQGQGQGQAQGPISVRQVLKQDLKGLAGQETIMTVIEVEPGASIPWNVHPDGHEISYVLEGTAINEIEGKPRQVLKAGEGFYIPPGVVHRGANEGPGTVKVLIVRVTAKGKPVTVPVKR